VVVMVVKVVVVVVVMMIAMVIKIKMYLECYHGLLDHNRDLKGVREVRE
jgi:hypothetical protein